MEVFRSAAPEFGFGPNVFDPYPSRPIEAVGEKDAGKLKEQISQSCPRVPGVYGMLDRRGQLIYVGKSKSLRSRLLSYFSPSNADQKGGRIIESARAIQWETQPSEFAALLREQQLIRRFSPRWNVQGVPKRQRPTYLCLGRQPATFFLSKTPPPDMIAVEGPFFGLGRMSTAIDALNNVFGLRDCGQKQVFHFADQMQLFDLEHRPGCLRFEIQTCLGPCAAGCTHHDYQLAVGAAESFMDGFNREPLDKTTESFERAIANQQYELAGQYHRTLRALDYVQRKLNLLASARRKYTFVYRVPGFDGRGIWYWIHSGEVAAVMAAPRNQTDRTQAIRTMKQWVGQSETTLSRGHGAHPHTLAVVASWFRKNSEELNEAAAPASRILEQLGSKPATRISDFSLVS